MILEDEPHQPLGSQFKGGHTSGLGVSVQPWNSSRNSLGSRPGSSCCSSVRRASGSDSMYSCVISHRLVYTDKSAARARTCRAGPGLCKKGSTDQSSPARQAVCAGRAAAAAPKEDVQTTVDHQGCEICQQGQGRSHALHVSRRKSCENDERHSVARK